MKTILAIINLIAYVVFAMLTLRKNQTLDEKIEMAFLSVVNLICFWGLLN